MDGPILPPKDIENKPLVNLFGCFLLPKSDLGKKKKMKTEATTNYSSTELIFDEQIRKYV